MQLLKEAVVWTSGLTEDILLDKIMRFFVIFILLSWVWAVMKQFLLLMECPSTDWKEEISYVSEHAV